MVLITLDVAQASIIKNSYQSRKRNVSNQTITWFWWESWNQNSSGKEWVATKTSKMSRSSSFILISDKIEVLKRTLCKNRVTSHISVMGAISESQVELTLWVKRWIKWFSRMAAATSQLQEASSAIVVSHANEARNSSVSQIGLSMDSIRACSNRTITIRNTYYRSTHLQILTRKHTIQPITCFRGKNRGKLKHNMASKESKK